MAFIGNKIIEKKEINTDLTIALNKIAGTNNKALFNNVLEVLKNYCEYKGVVYVLKKNGIIQTIHDFKKDYFIVFSNEFLAMKYSKGMYDVSEIEQIKLLRLLMIDAKISGMNFDRDTCGLIVETHQVLEKIFGIRDIYRIDIKDWGIGIPDYNENQLMNKEMLLDFGIQVVGEYLIKNDYRIIHASNRLDSNPNMIAIKDNKLCFIMVESSIAPVQPTILVDTKKDILKKSYIYKANPYYASVSFGSADEKRFNESIALQGDSFLANFEGLQRLESQYN